LVSFDGNRVTIEKRLLRAAAVGVLAGRWLVGSGSLHRLKQQYGLQIMELSRDSHAVRTISKQKFPGLLVGGDTAEVLWRRTISCHTTTYTAHSPAYFPNASFCLLHLQVFSDPQLNDHPIKGKKKKKETICDGQQQQQAYIRGVQLC
jgi:hypothetical protein